MRAIVIHEAKDLRIEEREEPVPGPGEVLVKMAAGGICGSDLHYYHDGGFGPVRIKEPMILGHEVSGHVADVGPGVEGLAPGDLVAISPSRPCGDCGFCREGLPNHCTNMRFYGSAMPFPHIQGAFRELLVVDASQCVRADGLEPGEAAMAEPFSVGLHATRRAGDLFDKKVLVTGSGPIGALAMVAARAAGASEVVAVDLSGAALDYARKIGADRVIDMTEQPDGLAGYQQGKGYFDVQYECSGAASSCSWAWAAISAFR